MGKNPILIELLDEQIKTVKKVLRSKKPPKTIVTRLSYSVGFWQKAMEKGILAKKLPTGVELQWKPFTYWFITSWTMVLIRPWHWTETKVQTIASNSWTDARTRNCWKSPAVPYLKDVLDGSYVCWRMQVRWSSNNLSASPRLQEYPKKEIRYTKTTTGASLKKKMRNS